MWKMHFVLFLAMNDSQCISIHWFQNRPYDLGNSSNLWFLKHVLLIIIMVAFKI